MKHRLRNFDYHRERWREIPWKPQPNVVPFVAQPFIRSLQRFQIGARGERRHLRAAGNTTGDVAGLKAIVLFIREKHEPARRMGAVLVGLRTDARRPGRADYCFRALGRAGTSNGSSRWKFLQITFNALTAAVSNRQ